MSVNLPAERTYFAYNDSHCFDTRDLIEGLQILKDKLDQNSDHIDFRNARPILKGSKDTNSFLGKTFEDKQKGVLPTKPCLMVPKEEGSDEKVEVRKAKSVHFADSCGRPLASVSTLFDSDDDLFAFANFNRNRGPADRNSFPALNKIPQQAKKGSTWRQRSRLLNFVQPVTLPNFYEKWSTNSVCLENVVFREFSIYGTIVVMNLDFEKQVVLRYTTDGWKTNLDAKGVHVPGSSTGKSDTFSFEVTVPPGSSEEWTIEFCIKYETSSGCYWDNNNGDNYRVLFCRSKSCSLDQTDTDGFVIGPASQRYAGYQM
eukprot:gene5648-6344_t